MAMFNITDSSIWSAGLEKAFKKKKKKKTHEGKEAREMKAKSHFRKNRLEKRKGELRHPGK